MRFIEIFLWRDDLHLIIIPYMVLDICNVCTVTNLIQHILYAEIVIFDCNFSLIVKTSHYIRNVLKLLTLSHFIYTYI